jgi:hypothetical protein
VYLPPHMASQLASERRREMLAQAEQQHRARKVAALARHHGGPSGLNGRCAVPSARRCGCARDCSNDGATAQPVTHA